ncbi:MAG: hypothetical protein ACM3X8_07175, partial [Methanomicrobiales archaeon]
MAVDTGEFRVIGEEPDNVLQGKKVFLREQVPVDLPDKEIILPGVKRPPEMGQIRHRTEIHGFKSAAPPHEGCDML